nr:hypothetical protein [Tanacetum cinerariifolium]
MFEFIGVLAFDTDVKDDKRGENEMANCFDEEVSVNLPSSKVPHLHCLVHRKLSVNDLISSSPTMKPKPDLLRGIRESLLCHLTVVLGDDELAAHFMLLHLLSKVHLRVDSVAVGKLSLNLIGFDKARLRNKQCAEGSHLTVDETPLQSGTLNNNGVENARLLKDLLDFQKVVEDDIVSARQVDQSLGTEDFNKEHDGRNRIMVPELDRNNLACLVKIYDTPESDLKLNDMFEFTGVLAFDTDVKDDKRGENEMANCFDEEESVNLPSSKVPCLYCLVHRKLSVNDLISSSPTMEPKPDLLRGICESLLCHLTVVLGDDELTTHFMLLHILSKVHLRVDSVPMGKLSLNLIGFDKSSIFNRTINVEYDFKYYKMKMDADVQLLILSEGKSNILPADIVLHFHLTAMGPLGNIDAKTLDAWRWYLATLRSLTYSIGTNYKRW